MDALKLQEYIWQGIVKKVCSDKLELYIPFFFQSDQDEPLRLTWDRNGVLSDGGRTLSELKKRVGNIKPYMKTICSILTRCGDCRLEGGQTIIKEHFQTVICGDEQCYDYLRGLNHMLMAISQISVLDTVSVSEDGEVFL